MKKILILIGVIVFFLPTEVYAGAMKTADALYATLDKIDAAKINNPSAKLNSAVKDAAKIIKGYWKMPRSEVYASASKIFDDLIAETKGQVEIDKPLWLSSSGH